jgi:CRISPR/Cas system-associated endonuclease Cas1
MNRVDPKLYGLPPRTVLMKKSSDEFVLVIDRKSRIILKDALLILKKVEQIKEKVQNASVVLETSAPVCSKSINFLNDKGIDVVSI